MFFFAWSRNAAGMPSGLRPAGELSGFFSRLYPIRTNFPRLWPTYSVIGYLLLTFFSSWPQYSVIGYLLLTFFISGLIMSGSQQIRVDRMNPCLFRHWITEWTKQNNKLPSQILAEEVQDTDEIPDFPTESNMESNQDDGDEMKILKRKFRCTENSANQGEHQFKKY